MHFVVCSKLLYCMLRCDLCCIANEHEWHCVLHFVIIQFKPFTMISLNVLGWKPLEKKREIHNFSITFSSDASFCLEGYFMKGILLYRKHALDLCFVTSYSMIRPECGEHISDCGLLSMSCPIAQGAILWYILYSPTFHTQRCNPSWSEHLCVQVPMAYIHPLRAESVSRAPAKATELSAVGFISPVRESVGFIPVLSWLHPTHIAKYSWLHHLQFSRANISTVLAN